MVVTRYLFVHNVVDDRYLLINSLSGAVDLVDEAVVRSFAAIRRGEPHSLNSEQLEELLRRGYLYESQDDEEAAISKVLALNERFRAREQALCFVLCPTVSCNLRCPYCFEPHAMHEQNQVMSLEQAEKAFAALDAIRAMRPDVPNASINLFGGEPLLPTTREVVTRILMLAAERQLPVTITTNGTHVKHLLEILRPYREGLAFDITMDGTKEIHDQRRITAAGTGTFDRISHNVSVLLADGFRVMIRMNLNAGNIDSAPLFLRYVREQNWHRFPHFGVSLSPVTNYTGLAGDDILPPFEVEHRVQRAVPPGLWDEVKVQLNGDFARLHLPISEALGESRMEGRFMPSLYYCEASGALFYCMAPDGLIYPCNQIIHNPAWAIGSYDPQHVIDPARASLWQDRIVTNLPKCRDCSIAFLCAGGCPVMAARTTGSPMEPHCGTAKGELAEYLRLVTPKLVQASK